MMHVNYVSDSVFILSDRIMADIDQNRMSHRPYTEGGKWEAAVGW
jgi:hypothetical protein